MVGSAADLGTRSGAWSPREVHRAAPSTIATVRVGVRAGDGQATEPTTAPRRHRVRGLALRLLKVTAAAGDRVRGRPCGIVVLAYHRVGGSSGLELDLPPTLFERQVAWLAESGRVLSLEAALARLDGPFPEHPNAGGDPVVLTFDDGTADFADVALPVLVRHQVPVTLYVATAFVEEARPFAGGAPALSWTALRDACATGLVTVGSHTHTHALLDRAPVETVVRELDASTGLLEDRLGVPVRDFAYPKAVLGSEPAQAAVRARFRSAALAGTHANPYGGTDPYRLARSPVQASDGWRWFRAKVGGGLRLEDDARRVLNRRRYAGATS